MTKEENECHLGTVVMVTMFVMLTQGFEFESCYSTFFTCIKTITTNYFTSNALLVRLVNG